MADTREHVIAWSYDHVGKKRFKQFSKWREIEPACQECNSTVGNKIFFSVDEKREYIQKRYRIKYKKILENCAVWEDDELEELSIRLRSGVKLKSRAKKWITNRIYYPQEIYKVEKTCEEQLAEILKIIFD